MWAAGHGLEESRLEESRGRLVFRKRTAELRYLHHGAVVRDGPGSPGTVL